MFASANIHKIEKHQLSTPVIHILVQYFTALCTRCARLLGVVIWVTVNLEKNSMSTSARLSPVTSLQGYKTFETTMGQLCIISRLQNIAYCCQKHKRT